MKIACRYLPIVIAAFLTVHGSSAHAQVRDNAPATTPASTDLATIASGWSALAAGRHAEAEKAADAVLAPKAGDHRALDLKIEALSGSEPLRALDAYETWLSRARIEDLFLLVPIARGSLVQLASSGDRALQQQALRRLAQSGDAVAAARLKELAQEPAAGAPGADVQRALEGDPDAAARLTDAKAAATVAPQTLARALVPAGAGAVPLLRRLLTHPAAPVRMEAALSLGKLGAKEAVADIKPMLNDPEVRSYAAVALTRLGDPEAETLVQGLLQSPVLDMRLLGALAYEGRGQGPWVQALMPALQDPNGLTRIRAAELLAPVAPDAARPVLVEAAKDPNPVVRADVLRVIEKTELFAPPRESGDAVRTTGIEGYLGLAMLRRLLRDSDPSTRLHAAGSILNLVEASR